jgi:hypothetical protein
MLLLAGTLLAPVAQADDVYKWLNEYGEVQYTQMPPPHGIQAIRIQSAPPIINEPDEPPDAPATEEQPADEFVDEQFQDAGQEDAADSAARDAELARSMKENCDNARKNLTTLNRGGQARFIKPNGEVFRLTEEERQQRINEAKDQIKLLCKG